MLPRISEEKEVGERLLGIGYRDGGSSEARGILDPEERFPRQQQRNHGTKSQWTIAILVLLNVITVSLLAIAYRNDARRTLMTPGALLLPQGKWPYSRSLFAPFLPVIG